ncbi:hypothetical protein LH935_18125 [Gordonia polyisoprenivorans]|uniref:hypothetical protein n=1 Tax=Gordonia polyisoprenivorans TaxID=84595 RepID=UPI002234DC28|nr:hypothetical protein [uncultured Gordonia sp.]UZF54647.1 hypothetical protein LH935_18125 [Gordonia polyisoprenivorans]
MEAGELHIRQSRVDVNGRDAIDTEQWGWVIGGLRDLVAVEFADGTAFSFQGEP